MTIGPDKRLLTFMSAFAQLTSVQLRRAAGLKEKIAGLQKQLDALLGGSTHTPSSSKPGPKRKKRTLSPAARARIVAAQKARWAKIRSEKKK